MHRPGGGRQGGEAVEELTGIIIVAILFLGMPMVVMHYAVQWKRARSLSEDDEQLMDHLQEKARRLEARLHSVERILDAENPHWRKDI
ncbi:envelope stress response membrane protein PspB [Pedomonas mirosovicensis]|uniref:envelope stress response membrane protein PspB n=1 Tax=Pedomonas mirosovicensis TaxID=2908641 RepID=UPI00216AB16D|nr:envelope stress response membrane protein PspB [Pedomonas mirosovicensis]